MLRMVDCRLLTAGAPVRTAVGVALAAGLDRGSTERTWPPGTFVDGALAATLSDRFLHQTPGRLERPAQLVLAEIPHTAPGIDAGGEIGRASCRERV